jgi:hypothetical protein
MFALDSSWPAAATKLLHTLGVLAYPSAAFCRSGEMCARPRRTPGLCNSFFHNLNLSLYLLAALLLSGDVEPSCAAIVLRLCIPSILCNRNLKIQCPRCQTQKSELAKTQMERIAEAVGGWEVIYCQAPGHCQEHVRACACAANLGKPYCWDLSDTLELVVANGALIGTGLLAMRV